MVKIALLFILLAASAPAADLAQMTSKEHVLWKKLETLVTALDKEFKGVAGIYITDLRTGAEITRNADEVFPAASTVKIAILAELLRQHSENSVADREGVSLEQPYVVDAADLVGGAGLLNRMTPAATRLTNRDLAVLMIGLSDNSATNVLIDRVGMENVNKLLTSAHTKHFRLRRKMMDVKAAAEGRENVGTARELGAFLAAIERGKVLDEAATIEYRELLATPKSTPFQRLLPEGAVIDDKSGELEGVRDDVGIVRAGRRTLVVSVMTGYARDEAAAEELLSRIALAAWQTADSLSRGNEYGRLVHNEK